MSAQNRRFLQLFWDLASLNDQAQSAAATILLRTLAATEEKYRSSADAAGSDLFVSGGDQTKLACSDELSYTLKRLLRGLQSSRDGARRGFSSALAEILAYFSYIPLSYILEQLSVVRICDIGLCCNRVK